MSWQPAAVQAQRRKRKAAYACPAAVADLVDPVGVEHPQATALAPHTLLSHAAQVAGGLQLGDTLAGWLSIDNALQEMDKQVAGSAAG